MTGQGLTGVKARRQDPAQWWAHRPGPAGAQGAGYTAKGSTGGASGVIGEAWAALGWVTMDILSLLAWAEHGQGTRR